MAKGNKKILTPTDMGSLSGVIVRDVKKQSAKDVTEEELTADFIKVNPIKEDSRTLKLQISAEMTDDFKKLLEKIDTVVNLNEQLTAENTNLLQKIDTIESELEISKKQLKFTDRNLFKLAEINKGQELKEFDLNKKIDELNEEVENQKLAYELLNDVTVSNAGKLLSVSSELSKIKSKWWYKLFKNI